MGLPFSRRGGGAALGVVFGGAPVGGAGRTRGSTRTHGSNEAVGGGRGGGRSAAIKSAFSKQCDVSILRSLATLLSWEIDRACRSASFDRGFLADGIGEE